MRYQPMYAKSATRPFSGEQWLFEIKWDGIRALAYISEDLSIRSRNDIELTGKFPELSELRDLAPGTVLDGEIIAMVGGRPDIQALLPRLQSRDTLQPPTGAVQAVYIVFDILEADGKSLTSLPLTSRREILMKRVREGPHVVLSVPVERDGEKYYRLAIEKGLEGVVAKRKESTYDPGARSGNWLKIKGERSCDCVIAGYTKGEGGRSPLFGALLLGLYEDTAEENIVARDQGKYGAGEGNEPGRTGLVYVGKVGTGFSDSDLAELTEIFSHGISNKPQLSGVEHPDLVTWLEPVHVCEVAYQSVTRERKLRIPRFVRIRDDKSPSECGLDQIGGIDPIRQLSGKSAIKTGPARDITGRAGAGELITYRDKRDFSATPEPEGDRDIPKNGNYFVVQEHHATHLHFDLRLERDGVLKSWAVPKGMPLEPEIKHLAVAVEDHPLDYGNFEGTIPAGEYGAGTVSIWDNGHYDVKHWDEGKIEVRFYGKKLHGPYVLVKFKRAGKNEWLIFRAGGP